MFHAGVSGLTIGRLSSCLSRAFYLLTRRLNQLKFNNKKESQHGEDLFKYRLEVGYNDRKRHEKEQGDARLLRKKQVREGQAIAPNPQNRQVINSHARGFFYCSVLNYAYIRINAIFSFAQKRAFKAFFFFVVCLLD